MLKLITAAQDAPVTLIEAKLHLRIDSTDEDALIGAMLFAASEVAEQKTGRALMPQTWELSLDDFPASFVLTRVPVASVTSIKYTNTAGVVATLDAGQYTLNAGDDFTSATVTPAYGVVWPATRGDVGNVKVRYVAGYEDEDSVPESIKSWIKLQVGAMYENRAAFADKQTYPMVFADGLLDKYRVYA